MKYWVQILVILMFCNSCDSSSGTESRDAQQIANAFILNVEALRRAELNGFKNAADPKRFFGRYVYRWNDVVGQTETSPFPTSSQIKVFADKIAYSRDSLLCVALLCIELNYTDMEPYTPEGQTGTYDGVAVIGYRDNKTDPFEIFPFVHLSTSGDITRQSTIRFLSKYYCNDIVGTVEDGGVYKQGIENPDFFIEAPPFQRNEYGDYNFKYFWSDKYHKYLPLIYAGNEMITSGGTLDW